VDGSRTDGAGGNAGQAPGDAVAHGRRRDKRPGEGDPGRLLQ
jgi:hypothetical protein